MTETTEIDELEAARRAKAVRVVSWISTALTVGFGFWMLNEAASMVPGLDNLGMLKFLLSAG